MEYSLVVDKVESSLSLRAIPIGRIGSDTANTYLGGDSSSFMQIIHYRAAPLTVTVNGKTKRELTKIKRQSVWSTDIAKVCDQESCLDTKAGKRRMKFVGS